MYLKNLDNKVKDENSEKQKTVLLKNTHAKVAFSENHC